MTAEEKRLEEDRTRKAYWRRWGPYLSDRQWGTVREDYSRDGSAWNYFPHEHARSRAYRWGEDGIAGISDNHQRLCFAIALWNGEYPILKERLFGLSGPEGNHGEDVKEYYFYLDNTPSHAYMKYLYKYPQKAFPYTQLVQENQQRGYYEPEFKLVDTGIFDNNFRNTWAWQENSEKPILREVQPGLINAFHPNLGNRWLYCQKPKSLLFTENETNYERLFGVRNDCLYVKDGINNYIVSNDLTG